MRLATFRHECQKSVWKVLDDPILTLFAARPRDMIGLMRAGGRALQAIAVAQYASDRPRALDFVGLLIAVKRPPRRSATGFNVVVHREIEGLRIRLRLLGIGTELLRRISSARAATQLTIAFGLAGGQPARLRNSAEYACRGGHG
jgi:hypothetical protein